MFLSLEKQEYFFCWKRDRREGTGGVYVCGGYCFWGWELRLVVDGDVVKEGSAFC